jgi:septal ring factor EnvC (AmiA/AmiB activator)
MSEEFWEKVALIGGTIVTAIITGVAVIGKRAMKKDDEHEQFVNKQLEELKEENKLQAKEMKKLDKEVLALKLEVNNKRNEVLNLRTAINTLTQQNRELKEQ